MNMQKIGKTRDSIIRTDDEEMADHPYHNTLNNEGYLSSKDMEPEMSWRITDFGVVKELSRDGSIHSTDEVINAATHLAAAMMSVLGTAILVSEASMQGAPWKIVSFSIYGVSLIALFTASTLHHCIIGPPHIERRLRMLDYLAIYPLIAGTFTPMCLIPYHSGTAVGWAFISVVWTLAIAGMIMTITMFEKVPKWLSMTIYITLGWLGAFFSFWLLPIIGNGGLFLFVLGGLFYTAGGYCFSFECPNPIPGKFGFHEIWHLAVIAGAASHWCIMYFYLLYW